MAQWIAYQTSNLGVAGSSPVGVVVDLVVRLLDGVANACRRYVPPQLLVLHSTSTRSNASRFRRGDSLGPHDHARAAVLLMIVVVLVATGLVLKLYEAFNGIGGDIADQVHGDVTPDS